MPNRVTIEALAGWLAERDDFVLIGHVNPDGDAAGTCLAVCEALRALGKRAVVCLPGGIPNLYAFLPGAGDVLEPGDCLPFRPRTGVSIDAGAPERLGDAGRRLYESCAARAMLDHHATNAGFGEVYALDGEAASAGEMAVRLIRALGVDMTIGMAECLFTAISTDCGQFSFSNTRAGTMEAAAQCIRAGADVAGITGRLYRSRTLGRTRLLGLVLAGLQISPDGRMAWARLTEDMLRRANAVREDNEGIVNYLVEIEGVRFAVLAEERDGQTKLSLRSKAPLDVARCVARPLGGGGHDCAAGCTLDMDLDAALAKVLPMAEAALTECGAGEAPRDGRR